MPLSVSSLVLVALPVLIAIGFVSFASGRFVWKHFAVYAAIAAGLAQVVVILLFGNGLFSLLAWYAVFALVYFKGYTARR